MQHSLMARGAQKIVEQCLAVKQGEKVLIITDTGRDYSLATSLAREITRVCSRECGY